MWPKMKKKQTNSPRGIGWEIIFLQSIQHFFIYSMRAKEICDFFLWFLYTYENVKHSRSQEDKISKTINGYTVPQDLNQFVYTSQI